MIEIKGKRNTAVVFADKIDRETKTQLAALLREEAFASSKIRIMPDTHSGKGAVVGTTMTLSGRVIPSLVGVDIGCGMETAFLGVKEADLARLDEAVHTLVPCGSKVHERAVAGNEFDLSRLYCREAVDAERAALSLGTLGGGNHFIELDRAGDGELVLVIHSGSRRLGSDVALYYKEQAYRYQCKKERKAARLSYYEKRSNEADDGYTGKIRTGSGQKENNNIKVSRENSVLEGELFEQYLHDIAIVQEFAELNRRTIADIICNAMSFDIRDRFSCVHNYIETERMILRKGAISARQNERVIIPLNMRDGSILGTGLGNPEWNFSAPHGAGRACSRTDAKFAYTVEQFKKEMEGIYTTTAESGSLDECPMAYKAPERILSVIGETVKIEQIIKPVYNFKAC